VSEFYKRPDVIFNDTFTLKRVQQSDCIYFGGGRPTLLTERIQLSKTQNFSQLCHRAKNLYNLANYLIRHAFFHQKRRIRYNTVYTWVKHTEVYRQLPAQTAQQVLRILDQNWSSFFAASKAWRSDPKKFQGRPSPPRYKPKSGESLVVFTNQQCCIRDGALIFPKKAQMPPIKTRINGGFRQIRVIPRGNHYLVELVYDVTTFNLRLDSQRVISIDLGLTNLVTVVNNAGLQPWRVKGGLVKSINQFYNKTRARLCALRDKQGLTGLTRRLQRLKLKRENKLRDIFHKVSRRLITYCVSNDFGRIVIGYNSGWKQRIQLGKRTNQNFVLVPFLMLVRQIRYKASRVGIEVILVEESNTSKVSFLDGEPVTHHRKYLGRRIQRELFRSSTGILVNADVNGAYNIGRIAIPEAFRVDGIEGVGLHPNSVPIEVNR
jgi:putative transposase